jgi:mannose-6-phosphate isomerase-like protein (cupin superfamily)
MKQVFQAGNYVTVPDGTDVSAFLNPTDSTQAGLPRDGLGDFSIASGRVRSGVHSWVHVHPIVTQVTYVTSGVLTVRMKEPEAADFYDVRVLPGQAVVSEPGTLFQLRNENASDAYVLYIVSPSYIFYLEDGEVAYDDAILVSTTWEELAARNYEVPPLQVDRAELRARREAARQALERRRTSESTTRSDDQSTA